MLGQWHVMLAKQTRGNMWLCIMDRYRVARMIQLAACVTARAAGQNDRSDNGQCGSAPWNRYRVVRMI
jgi:hypothetical protein